MTVEALERVMWRLRKNSPGNDKPYNRELRRAIMYECGTDIRTYNANRRALIDLGWIRKFNNKRVRLTNDDITNG